MSFTVPRKTRSPILVLLVLILIVGIATAAILLTQTIPSETVPPQTVTSSCASIAPTSTLPAGGGAIQFPCGTPSGPAFTTVAGTSTPSAGATPGPYPNCPASTPCYVTFGYVPHGDTTSCTVSGTQPNFHEITTPNTATFLTQTWGPTAPAIPPGSWDYCGIYNSPPAGGTLSSFSIGWS